MKLLEKVSSKKGVLKWMYFKRLERTGLRDIPSHSTSFRCNSKRRLMDNSTYWLVLRLYNRTKYNKHLLYESKKTSTVDYNKLQSTTLL